MSTRKTTKDNLTCLTCGKPIERTDCGLPKCPGCQMNDRLRQLEASALDEFEHRRECRDLSYDCGKDYYGAATKPGTMSCV